MLEDTFEICNVCGKEFRTDGNKPTKYCKLCGIPTESMEKFCCEKCENIFRWLKVRKKLGKWKKDN